MIREQKVNKYKCANVKTVSTVVQQREEWVRNNLSSLFLSSLTVEEKDVISKADKVNAYKAHLLAIDTKLPNEIITNLFIPSDWDAFHLQSSLMEMFLIVQSPSHTQPSLGTLEITTYSFSKLPQLRIYI